MQRSLTALEASRLTEIAQRPVQRVAQHFMRIVMWQAMMQARNGADSLTYAVPWMVFGMPLYDVRQVVQAMARKLEDKGFQVSSVGRVLQVSWCSRPQEQRWASKAHRGKLVL